MATNEELTQSYQALRERCVLLGRGLSADQAATMSPCCPAWSVKDLFAHLAGVPVDILEGNLEGAATEAWADAHVARRADNTLTEILDEWEATAEGLDPLLHAAAASIDPRFFLDCWTHEWDVRQALGAAAVPDMALPSALLPQIVDTLTERDASNEFTPVLLQVETSEGTQELQLGTGEPAAALAVSLFEFSRLVVGRRSESQIQALGPTAVAKQLIYFDASPVDIVDPVLRGD